MAPGAAVRCAGIATGVFCAGVLAALGTTVIAPAPPVFAGERVPRTPPVGRKPSRVLRGITAPPRTAKLGSVHPERITRIAVTEGCFVSQGSLLVMLEDHVQRVQVEMAEAAARSTLQIDLARELMDRASKDVDRLSRLNGVDHASRRELQDARTRAESARLEYEIARFEHTQKIREHQRQQALLEQLSIRAPFDGYVTKLHKQVGETVDRLEDIVTVVQLDPLEVWLDCPVRLADTVHRGDRVMVRPVDPHWPPRVGEVIFANRVADPASQTFKIKLTVSNQDAAWMSGLKVTVDLGAVRPPKDHAGATGPAVAHPGPARTRTGERLE